MKILLIAASHGNELAGIKFYQHLLRTRSDMLEHIDFLIGNPQAYVAKKRYIDSDLNRSYGVTTKGREVERAKEIASYIDVTKPDLVIDMHSTNCIQPACLIVGDTSGAIKQQFIRSSHVNHILQVSSLHDIASLGDNVIGYEVPSTLLTSEMLRDIEDDIRNFIQDAHHHKSKHLFRMTDKIYKAEVSATDISTFVNFEMHPLGFVPIMTGDNSYSKQTDYVGFKSLPPEMINL